MMSDWLETHQNLACKQVLSPIPGLNSFDYETVAWMRYFYILLSFANAFDSERNDHGF